MGNSGSQKHLGIYISPKEISIAQVTLGKNSRPEAEHLVKFPTNFPVKEGMLRPLSLNHEFFDEKAPWVAPFRQAVKRVSWDTSSAVVTLSPQFAILRYFVMPAVERRFWNKSIPLESKKYIPVSFDEIVYDFNAVPVDGGRKLGVLFGLTQRKSVEFIIEVLKSAGLALASVEATPLSMERLTSVLDPADHYGKGYIHFSGNVTGMLFSHGGYPVLYRETESDSGGTMSDRKRLDIKGAMQFVDRYVGGKDYKSIQLSGDGLDSWLPAAAKEAAPVQVESWNPAGLCGLKDNDAANLFSVAAALRGRTQGPRLPDISGISTASELERKVQSYVWNTTFLLGGLLLLLAIFSQARLFMIGSQVSSLKMKVMNVPELEGLESQTIRTRIEALQVGARILDTLLSDQDPVAPKLGALADLIPSDLWVTNISYSDQFNLSEAQGGEKLLRIGGETLLTGQFKVRTVDAFTAAVRGAPEFKIYSPPFGSVDRTMEQAAKAEGYMPGDAGVRRKTSGFAVVCGYSRK